MTRPNESGGGGLTGATGDLTPDDADEPFVPAEWREMNDPERQGDVTTSHGRSAPAQRGDIGAPGESDGGGGASRDGGTGSEHGLSGADPAYRMQSRASTPDEEREDGEPRSSAGDGDEFADHQDHF